MGNYHAGGQKMEKIKELWYKIVAGELWRRYLLLSEQHRRQVDLGRQYLAEWIQSQRILKETKGQLRVINQQLDMLKQDPLGATIDTNRHRAQKQRIQDLERQLRHNGIEPQ